MLRVLRPDGDVRQDIDLLVARDTGAQSAKVSRVCDPPGMWCPAGHRFTAPDGVSTHYDTPSRQGVYLCRNSKAVKTIWGAGIKTQPAMRRAARFVYDEKRSGLFGFGFSFSCAFGLEPFVEPAEEEALPEDGVLRLQYPVVFIREDEHFGGDAAELGGIEGHFALR